MITLGFCIYVVVCGGLTAFVANSKGRDGVAWFIIGAVFGVLGLIAAAGVGPIRKEESRQRDPMARLTKAPSVALTEQQIQATVGPGNGWILLITAIAAVASVIAALMHLR